MALQVGSIGLFTYRIIDAYVTPYESEWLTPTAFVPYYLLGIFITGACMLFSAWIIRSSEGRYAWLGLLPLAGVTLFPYWAIIHDAIKLGSP